MFPEGSIIIKNPNGTAPSFIVEEKNKSIICLPGVPFEMKWLVENEVIPYLRKRYELKRSNKIREYLKLYPKNYPLQSS